MLQNVTPSISPFCSPFQVKPKHPQRPWQTWPLTNGGSRKLWNSKFSTRMLCVSSKHIVGEVFSLSRAPPMVWQFRFGICYCLPTPNCKCKGKNMVIPMVWHFRLGNYLVDPAKSLRVSFCHTRVFPRACFPSSERRRRRSQSQVRVRRRLHLPYDA